MWKKPYVILDGTVLPIGRLAADRPYCSGKKKHHGMNVQVLADPIGRLIWASDELPGAVHDLTAARFHGIPATLTAEKSSAAPTRSNRAQVLRSASPFRVKNLRGRCQRHNHDHAKIRGLGEHAMATLKCWRLLRRLRCSTTRITHVVRAIIALKLKQVGQQSTLSAPPPSAIILGSGIGTINRPPAFR